MAGCAGLSVPVAALLPGALGPTSSAAAASVTGYAYAHGPGATTLAGTGVPGYNGDGRSALRAQLQTPAGIAEDAAGDLFIADSGNCRVREVPARTGTSFGRHVHAGVIVTLVGGPCRDADNPAPNAVALDAAGDLFIASGTGARVEVLPAMSGTVLGVRLTAGKLAAVAGTGVPGYNGDGESATSAELDDPGGVAVDPHGDLLIADTANCRVRLVAASDGTRFGVPMVQGHIYTVAGNGICGSAGDGGPALSAEVWDPGALAVDHAGDVLVADQGNRTIRELAAQTGTFYGVPLSANDLGTVAGEGSYGPYLNDGLPAVFETGELNFPAGLAVGTNGNLYIADGDMHVIRMVPDTATTLLGKAAQPDDLYTVAGAFSVGPLHNRTTWIQTRMLDPTGLAISPDGRLVYSDAGADVVRELPSGR